MLIRRKNWPAFLTLAIFGPLLGAFLAMKVLPFKACPSDRAEEEEVEKAAADSDADRTHHTADELLRLPDGDRIAPEELAPDRSVAIVVMKAPWCPVCRRQLQRLAKNMQSIQDANGVVVGLTAASPAKNRKLMEELDLPFPILSDASKQFHHEVDLWPEGGCHAIPGVVFLDESGDIAEVHKGRYPGNPQDAFILDTLDALSE